MLKRLLLSLLLTAGCAMTTSKPPPKPTSAAEPAVDPFLKDYAETRRFSAGRPVKATATPDGKAVLFLRSGPRSFVQSLYETELATGQTRELITAEAVLKGAEEQLSEAEKARRERQRVSARGFTAFQLSRDGARLVLSLGGRLYLVERATGKVTALQTGAGPIDPQLSPDGALLAYVLEKDLYVLDLSTNQERRITTGGGDRLSHGLAEFVAQEEMHRFTGYWWSPDSKWLAFEEADDRAVETFTISDPMHPERPASTFAYPRPGKTNATVRLGITSAAGGGKITWASWDAAQYPYLATVRWSQGAPLTALVQNRLQTEEVLLKVDPASGATTPLLVERDPAWLNLDQSFPIWLEDGSGFLWRTERNGAPEVELRSADGQQAQSWVGPGDHFMAVAGFAQPQRTLYFLGAPDPTQRRLYRVTGGQQPELLEVGLPAPAMMSGAISRNGEILVVGRGDLKTPGATTVHRAKDLSKLAELPSVAERPPFTVTTELRQVAGFWASITRPHDFVPGKKLPVILQVYGGPHVQVVEQVANPLDQWQADHGYLVVSFDGRGTPGRGSKWERAILNDFSQAPLDDQVTALQALAKELPELDLARVGVEGWSFGGYMAALAVLRRPDVFKAAVAGAPVVDWRDYDTHYTERYLKLPDQNQAGYDQSSLLTWAPKLERPLLLIHGTADDNVYFFHTLKLSDALFRAGRPHRVLPLSGFTHMVPDPNVTTQLERLTLRFFEENL